MKWNTSKKRYELKKKRLQRKSPGEENKPYNAQDFLQRQKNIFCFLVYWYSGLKNPTLVVNEVGTNTPYKFGNIELKTPAVYLFVLVEVKNAC